MDHDAGATSAVSVLVVSIGPRSRMTGNGLLGPSSRSWCANAHVGIPGIEQGPLIGARGARIGGRSSAGAVVVVKPGLRAIELHQNHVGVPGTSEKGDP